MLPAARSPGVPGLRPYGDRGHGLGEHIWAGPISARISSLLNVLAIGGSNAGKSSVSSLGRSLSRCSAKTSLFIFVSPFLARDRASGLASGPGGPRACCRARPVLKARAGRTRLVDRTGLQAGAGERGPSPSSAAPASFHSQRWNHKPICRVPRSPAPGRTGVSGARQSSARMAVLPLRHTVEKSCQMERKKTKKAWIPCNIGRLRIAEQKWPGDPVLFHGTIFSGTNGTNCSVFGGWRVG